jgi:hypothetical protein
MTTENARQPKGIPVGGQFAATTHAEPALTLAPVSARDSLRAGLAAAAEKHEALLQADWAETVWAKYPHASFADVHVSGEGNGERFTAGVDLYDPEGVQIDLDMTDEAALEDTWDVNWKADAHRVDARVAANMGPYSNAFSLDSIKERWDAMSSTPEPLLDPFAHLTGMDKARAQGTFARQINDEAASAYVADISGKLLAANPDAARLYFNRKADVESGLTFDMDRVEDSHRNAVDIDLSAFEDTTFQDGHLDGHLDYDESNDGLYLNLDTGN